MSAISMWGRQRQETGWQHNQLEQLCAQGLGSKIYIGKQVRRRHTGEGGTHLRSKLI